LEALRPTLGANSVFEFLSSDNPAPSTPIPQQTRQLVMVASVAIAALGGIWVMLRPGGMWLRLAALAALIGAGAFYLAHLGAGAEGYLVPTTLSLAVAFAAVAGLCAVSVLPVRLMGYRLQRPIKRLVGASIEKDVQPHAERAVAAVLVVAIVVLNGSPVVKALQRGTSATNEQFGRDVGIIFPFSTDLSDQMQPPISACRQWIDYQSVSPWSRRYWLIKHSWDLTTPVKLSSLMESNLPGEAQGTLSDPLEGANGASGGEEKSDERTDE
jgi:hypothetical protein